MNAIIRLLACCLLIGALAGCATPARRATQNPAAFHKLSPSDQRLVLKGKIRPGLDRDAVFIAWGAPDWKLEGGKGNEECESWIYYRELTTYLPISSYGTQLGVDFLEPRFELGLSAYGPDAPGSDGSLYSPHVMISDVRLKRADFRDGRLHNYSVRRGSHYLATVP